MLNKIRNNKAAMFLIKAAALYILWEVGYVLFLHPNSGFDYLLINNLTAITENILTTFGYKLMTLPAGVDTMGVVGIDGSHGVLIGYPCNGLELFALFAGYIIAFPGNIKTKFWFIPLGLFIIHLLNIIRVIALVFVAYKAPEYLDFNHTYTFTIFVYSVVFILWMIWTMKLSKTDADE